jgi:predicted component of type VI protein secretion system
MRKIILVSLALAAVVSACSRTPAEPESRARAEATARADANPADSTAARGGNLMGSGH